MTVKKHERAYMNEIAINLILLYLSKKKVKKGPSIIIIHFQMFDNLTYISTVTHENDYTFFGSGNPYYKINFLFLRYKSFTQIVYYSK